MGADDHDFLKQLLMYFHEAEVAISRSIRENNVKDFLRRWHVEKVICEGVLSMLSCMTSVSKGSLLISSGSSSKVVIFLSRSLM